MGKLLDWDNMPPIGTKVVFKGYRNGRHKHWGYVIGKTYTIGQDADGDIGSIAICGDAPEENYGDDFIFELVEFTKSDLKDGMRVHMRNEHVWWVCGKNLLTDEVFYCHGIRQGFHFSLNRIKDDLTHDSVKECDIMRVTDRDGTVLFEREEALRELTIEEIAEAFNLPVERVRIKK